MPQPHDDAIARPFAAGPSHGLATIRDQSPTLTSSHESAMSTTMMPAGLPPSAQFSIGMLLRMKWLILGVFVLVAATAIPLIWLFVVPEYRATAMVRVAPVVPRLLYQYEETGLVPLYQSYLQTQVSLIRSPVILEQVLDDREVRETEWFKNPPKPLLGSNLPALQRLIKCTAVAPRQGTELINVSVGDKNASDAQIIVNKIVRQYENYASTAEEKKEELRFQVLTDKQAELRDQIEGKIRTKSLLESKLGTSEPTEIRTRVADRLVALEQEREDLNLEKELNQWRIDYLAAAIDLMDAEVGSDEAAEESGASKDPTEQDARYRGDAIWRLRQANYEEAKLEAELGRDHFGDHHPTMKQLKARATHMETLLVERERELDDPRFAPVVVQPDGSAVTADAYNPDTLQRSLAEADFRKEQLSGAIDNQKKRVDDVNQKAQTIERLDDEIVQLRDQLDDVSQRLNVLRIEKKGKELGRVSIAATAVLPVEPSSDRRALLTIVAFAAAFASAVGLAFLKGMLDPSVREAQDVRATVRIPFLGVLPRVEFDCKSMDDSAPEVRECMRMVRTALLDRLGASGGRTVAVTSPGPQSGKTSVSMLLAKSLARAGKRVLLVDADLRQRRLSEQMGVASNQGLTDVLSGRVNHSEAIVASSVDRVDLLPSGKKVSEGESELMANGVFKKSIDHWKETYDFVLFDSAPVLPVADARILASQVDGTILTLRSAFSRRAEAVEAIDLLGAAGGKTIGTILVGVEPNLIYGYGDTAY